MKRSSFFLTPKQAADLEQAVKTDTQGRKKAGLVRAFIGEGLIRLKRQQRAAKQ
jgi:hypothetical protein